MSTRSTLPVILACATAAVLVDRGCAGAAPADTAAVAAPAPPRAATAAPRPGAREAWTRVRGTVVDARGPVAAAPVRVEVCDAGGRRPWRVARTNAQGEFEFVARAPARYAIEASTWRHARARLELDVGARDAPVVGLALEALPPAGAVRGRIRSESGEYRGSVLVEIGPEGRLPWTTEVHWRRGADGHAYGEFEFPDLPWGEYRLRLLPPPDDLHEWTALEMRVRPPHTDLEFACLDADAKRDLTLSAWDSETGAEIERFDVCLRWQNDWQAPRCERARGSLDLWSVPFTPRLVWSVEAEGYEPASGDLGALLLPAGGDCDVERLSVPLRPAVPPADRDVF